MIFRKYKYWIFAGIGMLVGVIIALLFIGMTPWSKQKNETVLRNSTRMSLPPSSLSEQTSLIIPPPQEGEPTKMDPQEMELLGDRYFENGQFDKAIELYEKVIGKDPKDVDTYNDLGLSYYYTQKTELAIETLRKGTDVNPLFQRIWLSLGFVLSSTGNLEEAKSALKNAVDLNPNNTVGKEATKMLQQIP